jgi:hypothetical protein
VAIIKQILPCFASNFYAAFCDRADNPIGQLELCSAYRTDIAIFFDVIVQAFEMKLVVAARDSEV